MNLSSLNVKAIYKADGKLYNISNYNPKTTGGMDIMKRVLSLTLMLLLLVSPCMGRGETSSFLPALSGHDTARQHLSPAEQKVYDYLKQQVRARMESGGSMEILLPQDVVDYDAFSLTAEEVAALFDAENNSSEPIFAAIRDRVWDMVHVALVALECDEPGLFFWEKGSLKQSDVWVPMSSSAHGAWIRPGELAVRYPVLPEYGSGYDLNREAVARGEAQLENARQIIEKYASASDYGKLRGYLNEILALATTVPDAKTEENSRNLVRVFDGDPETGVFCVGFSRAFAFLCSHTAFESPQIKCVFIAGLVDRNASYHAWNVVTMEDGKNYLVDSTFAYGDEDLSYRYFLRGQAGGSLQEGYLIPYTEANYSRYAYGNGVMTDMDCVRLFGAENLTLADADYPLAQMDREAQQEVWASNRPRLLDATPGIVANEGPENLFDNSVDTKWCVSMEGSASAFVEWQEPEPRALWGFAMGTANDNSFFPGRNPASWTLSAKNSPDEDWHLIWAKEGDSFMQDVDKNVFAWRFAYGDGEPETNLYFRLEITQTQGAPILQLSKIEIIYEAE